MLRRPDLLLLDEATSALDSESEVSVRCWCIVASSSSCFLFVSASVRPPLASSCFLTCQYAASVCVTASSSCFFLFPAVSVCCLLTPPFSSLLLPHECVCFVLAFFPHPPPVLRSSAADFFCPPLPHQFFNIPLYVPPTLSYLFFDGRCRLCSETCPVFAVSMQCTLSYLLIDDVYHPIPLLLSSKPTPLTPPL